MGKGKKVSKKAMIGEVYAQHNSGISVTLEISSSVKAQELGFCALVLLNHWARWKPR